MARCYGEALVHAGHGGTWSAAVDHQPGVLGHRLAVGRHRATRPPRAPRAATRSGGGGRGYAGDEAGLSRAPRAGSRLRSWLRIGPRIAALAVDPADPPGEHGARRASAGRAFDPGLLLTPEYAGGLWIDVVVGPRRRPRRASVRVAAGVLVARLRDARPTNRAPSGRPSATPPGVGRTHRVPPRATLRPARPAAAGRDLARAPRRSPTVAGHPHPPLPASEEPQLRRPRQLPLAATLAASLLAALARAPPRTRGSRSGPTSLRSAGATSLPTSGSQTPCR